MRHQAPQYESDQSIAGFLNGRKYRIERWIVRHQVCARFRANGHADILQIFTPTAPCSNDRFKSPIVRSANSLSSKDRASNACSSPGNAPIAHSMQFGCPANHGVQFRNFIAKSSRHTNAQAAPVLTLQQGQQFRRGPVSVYVGVNTFKDRW